jgi:hypothetical protein
MRRRVVRLTTGGRLSKPLRQKMAVVSSRLRKNPAERQAQRLLRSASCENPETFGSGKIHDSSEAQSSGLFPHPARAGLSPHLPTRGLGETTVASA